MNAQPPASGAQVFRADGNPLLGVFAQALGSGGGTVFHHNGATIGSAALMDSTPDGRTTMTAGLTSVDDADMSVASAFQAAQQRLVRLVFRGGQDAPARPTG
ncbi:hypothetical protein ACFVJ8_26190 [Streptomyces yangpuensis]|uniref:hypothetical protein n=1 Tax=Streptomyces yangpuensis TaxID=1648182 RepID=UPI0036336CEE